MDATPMFSINSSFSSNGVSEEKDKQAFANYQRILALLAEASAQPGVKVAFNIKMHVNSPSEHPPLPPSPPPEREEVAASEEEEDSACNICSDLPEWVEMDEERGICCNCANHLDEGLKYYTEEFADASLYGKDATHLLVLRQRADNCRDTIAYAAASYDGDLEAHEASVQEKLLNRRAAECLARLPPSFAPWWKDTWSHEKWCEMAAGREEVGWVLDSADAPAVKRLAAMFLDEKNRVRAMDKEIRLQANDHQVMLANIERARTEDMESVEARHKRKMEGLRDQLRAAEDGCEKKCHDARRSGYAMGYAFADQKATKVIQAMRSELDAARKEGANHQDAYIRLIGERDELVLKEADLRQELDESAEANEKLEAQVETLRMELAVAEGNLEGTEVAASEATKSAMQVVEGLRKELTSTKTDLIRAQDSAKKLEAEVDAATKIFQAMRSDLERLSAENKALRQEAEEDKQMVQRHLKEIAKEHAKMMAWETQRLQEENKGLQKKHDYLLELVEPTVKLMKSNPELFGGEARGTSSPRPPPIIRLPPMKEEVKEEDKERALNFLRSMVAPSRPCVLVEGPPAVLSGIVEAEPSTEGLCMALTGEQVQQMQQAEAAAQPSPGEAAPEPVAEAPPEPVAEAAPEPVAEAPPEPVAEAAPEPVAEAPPEAKPKPNYNHPNWPSPITKRFAKHLAKHSGLRSPWHRQDPKSIRTHEDALEFIAKRANISVETLLTYPMKYYQTGFAPWTLVQGSSKYFHMGAAPATWWC
jgi:hypothetical protein